LGGTVHVAGPCHDKGRGDRCLLSTCHLQVGQGGSPGWC
jgi:hypothetical protein